MQNPAHVKSLPTGLANAENGIDTRLGLGFLSIMRLRLKFVMAVTLLALATALVPAQTAEFDALRHKAEAGDAKAQFDLADAYSEGKGIAKDSAKGTEWLKRSALQGYAGAQVVLGYFYQKGINTEKDPSEAAKWYRKAAKQSDKDLKHAQIAQTHLSEMLSDGSISAKEADWHASEASTTIPKQTKTNKPPFSLGEVETGLTGGITSKRMATLVNIYGVDFTLSASARKRLADKGADDSLLATIASAKR
ncbi:MAG TPA: tetratricopeptide repeat protein [Candidatus Sulfotelmatobacter sp.]|nr:tetratricopeptide repeat protein [Candidatus Sulfotelmatobacter sp.]